VRRSQNPGRNYSPVLCSLTARHDIVGPPVRAHPKHKTTCSLGPGAGHGSLGIVLSNPVARHSFGLVWCHRARLQVSFVLSTPVSMVHPASAPRVSAEHKLLAMNLKLRSIIPPMRAPAPLSIDTDTRTRATGKRNKPFSLPMCPLLPSFPPLKGLTPWLEAIPPASQPFCIAHVSTVPG
jgi:hypothetical protein